MSMQHGSSGGMSAVHTSDSRYSVIPMHNASNELADVLRRMWSGKTPAEAHEVLARPDVLVTNQSDKTLQLGKIEKLNEMVIEAFEMHTAREAALKQLARAMASRNLKSIDGALAIAKQAGVAPANIRAVEEARAAAAAAEAKRQADIAAAEAKRRADLAKGEAKRVKVLDAFSEAQRAFDRVQQVAKDEGVEVKLSCSGDTLKVEVRTAIDGKSDSRALKKSLEHLVGTDGVGSQGGCCVVM